jgi:hypothetical protein
MSLYLVGFHLPTPSHRGTIERKVVVKGFSRQDALMKISALWPASTGAFFCEEASGDIINVDPT